MNLTAVAPRLDREDLDFFAFPDLDPNRLRDGKNIVAGPEVRRIIQHISDLARKPFNELRILDLGCHKGAYAIECALRGAEVVAIDGRTERMDQGARIARKLGLDRLRFEQADARDVSRESYGEFDVVLCLGLLYHLDKPEVFTHVESLHGMSRHMVILDTQVASRTTATADYKGRRYNGDMYREHEDQASEETRIARVVASLDNTFSFFFTLESLVRFLVDAGFTSVLEGYAPLKPAGIPHRVTLVAIKGERVRLTTHPWLNELTEDELAAIAVMPPQPAPEAPRPGWKRRLLEGVLRGPMHALGYNITRR